MGRRQQSSIDLLPERFRDALNELLRNPQVQQIEACRRINEMLAEEGIDDRLSKSSVNRYAQRMEKIGSRIRQGREVAQMWIANLGAEPQGEVGKLLNEMIRNLAFDVTSKLMELMDDPDKLPQPKMLRDLAIAVEKLEKAASENIKRDEEIRKQAKAEAAQAAISVAKKSGLSDEAANEIKAKILGVK